MGDLCPKCGSPECDQDCRDRPEEQDRKIAVDPETPGLRVDTTDPIGINRLEVLVRAARIGAYQPSMSHEDGLKALDAAQIIEDGINEWQRIYGQD